jgi:hypothetical protein
MMSWGRARDITGQPRKTDSGDDDDVDDKVSERFFPLATLDAPIRGDSERIQNTIDLLLQSCSRADVHRLRRVAPVFDRVYRVRATCATLPDPISSVLERLSNTKQTADTERTIAHISARVFRTCDLSVDEVILVVQRTVRCTHQYATSCAFLALIQLGFSSHIGAFLDSPAGAALKARYKPSPQDATGEDFVTRSKLGLAAASVLIAIQSGMFATVMYLLRIEWIRENISLATLQTVLKAIGSAIHSGMVTSATNKKAAVLFESHELAQSATNSLLVEDNIASVLKRLEAWIQQNTRPSVEDRALTEAGRIRYDMSQIAVRAIAATKVHDSVADLIVERLRLQGLESAEAKAEAEAKIAELQERTDVCDAVQKSAPKGIDATAVAEKSLDVLRDVEMQLYRYRLHMAAERSLLEARLTALDEARVKQSTAAAEEQLARVRASISSVSEADYFPS